MAYTIRKVLSATLDSIPVIDDQIIYCTDTYDYFVDSPIGRSQVVGIVKLENDDALNSYENPTDKYIYLVKSTDNLYKYNASTLEMVQITIEELVESMPVYNELTPVTIRKDGVAYAPRTLASNVFLNDGTRASDAIQDFIVNGKRFIMKTSTALVSASENNQTIFQLKAPFDNYDYDKFPVHILLDNEYVSPALYIINPDTGNVILSDKLNVTSNSVVTEIFHYIDTVCEDYGLDAEKINGTRIFVRNDRPIEEHYNDIWIDTTNNAIKQFNGYKWVEKIISSGIGGSMKLNCDRSTSTITNYAEKVAIGIPAFNKDTDTLLVFVNSTYIEEGIDYEIDADGEYILSKEDDGWHGEKTEQQFNFIMFKNVGTDEVIYDGRLLYNASISYDKLTYDLQKKIDDAHPDYYDKKFVDENILAKMDFYDTVFEYADISYPLSTVSGEVLLTDEGLAICAD